MSEPALDEGVQRKEITDETDAKGAGWKRSRVDVGGANVGHGGVGQSLEEILSDIYKMDYPRRGNAIIINNRDFTLAMETKGYKQRTGTDVDARIMRERLESLGFDLDMHKNKTCAEIMNILSHAAQSDHSDADCFVCVLLSHGEEGIIFGVDGPLEIKAILEPFKGDNCPTLVGKPKLFFIQACRGSGLDPGVYQNVADGNKRPFEETEFRVPSEADFLIAYSTVPGFYSWRNSQRGSWFIQALQFILEKHGASMEMMKIMTKVNKLVAQDFQSNTFPSLPHMHQMKQTPCICSMLTKDLVFTPKEYPMDTS